MGTRMYVCKCTRVGLFVYVDAFGRLCLRSELFMWWAAVSSVVVHQSLGDLTTDFDDWVLGWGMVKKIDGARHPKILSPVASFTT